MIEIVFGDSACGSLKAAQGFGKGKYIGGCTSVILSKEDGSSPSQEEVEAAQREAEARFRLEWEQATPLGGNPQDVFGFTLLLSVGDISQENFLKKRQKVIDSLWSIYPQEEEEGEIAQGGASPFDMTSHVASTLDHIRSRVAQGEELRIWYSHQPDELCGLYWFLSELSPLGDQLGAVTLVKLPTFDFPGDNRVQSISAWGEVPPGDWHRFSALGELASPLLCRHLARLWRQLQQENAPLRAVLNGKLHSMEADLYDPFLLREIQEAETEFQEAMLVGKVLGKYQLGISDAWISHRIQTMIQSGTLEVLSPPPKDMPSYHRRLRKAGNSWV